MVLLASPLLWTIAYQYKTTYTVDIGGPLDDAYVSQFFAKEPDPAITARGGGPGYNYRWSGASSQIDLPAIGNEPVQLTIATAAGRPSGAAPAVTITARGQSFVLQTQNQLHSETFFIDRGDPLQTDFRITISAPTFSTASDPRQLGVVVDRVTVAPASYGLRPPVLPPPVTLLELLAGVAGLFFATGIATRSSPLAAILASASSIVTATGLMVARTELGLLAQGLPALAAWTVGLAVVGRVTLEALCQGESTSARFVTAAGSAAFALAFALRFGGLTYPQFLTSDIMLHVHNVQKVMHGQWVFPGFLPDGTAVPYPPALYVALAPVASALGGSDEAIALLLKWSGAVLDSAACLALSWTGWRLWDSRVGGFAALAYAVSPAPFDLFSAGNYSNLFGQSLFNITLLGGLVFVGSRMTTRFGLWVALLTAGMLLTMLGHYGMMLGTLAILGIFAVWATVASVRRMQTANSWWLLAATSAALLASVAIYYWRFIGEIRNQFSGVLDRLAGQGGHVPPRTSSGGPGSTLAKLGGKMGQLLGAPPVILGTSAMALTGQLTAPARALLYSWLVATAIFALLDQAVGDALRWYYLGAAALSLALGRFMGLLSTRRRWASALIWLTFSALLLQLLAYWVGNLIFTRYHVP